MPRSASIKLGFVNFSATLSARLWNWFGKKAAPTVTVREIYDVLRHERQIAYTTVMTTMVRLAEKGMLRIVDKAGLANCYAPAETRQEFLQNAVARVLDIFIKDFPDEANQFLEEYANRAKKQPTRKR